MKWLMTSMLGLGLVGLSITAQGASFDLKEEPMDSNVMVAFIDAIRSRSEGLAIIAKFGYAEVKDNCHVKLTPEQMRERFKYSRLVEMEELLNEGDIEKAEDLFKKLTACDHANT